MVTGRQALTGYYDADLSRFEYQQLRLTDRDSIAEVAGRIGHLDVLVNNASATSRRPWTPPSTSSSPTPPGWA